MPKADFVRTGAFRRLVHAARFLQRHGVPDAVQAERLGGRCRVSNRSLGDFEADDLTELGRFAGHFGRALSIRLDRERTAEQLAAANLMLDDIRDAILLIDRDLRLCHANAAARAMLEPVWPYGRITAGSSFVIPRTHAKLARMAAEGAGASFASSPRGGGGRSSGSPMRQTASPYSARDCQDYRSECGTRAADPGPIAGSAGIDAPPVGGDRRAGGRRDGDGGGPDARPRGADPAYPYSAGLRKARFAKPGRAFGAARPAWLRYDSDPKINYEMSSAQMDIREAQIKSRCRAA